MANPTITKEEFEALYAKRSNMTIEELRKYGREARPCDCDAEGCQGWQMAHVAEDTAWAWDEGYA